MNASDGVLTDAISRELLRLRPAEVVIREGDLLLSLVPDGTTKVICECLRLAA
ncbi:MAG: hypothetical protein M9890_03705 [Thermomicrobiales bacterium]|nr:hypothetical protein [Thermomicrobiales bacterium]